MTERTSIWLLIVLPIVVALVLLVPLSCVAGSGGDCIAGEPCPAGEQMCYSLVGVPANGIVGAVGGGLAAACGVAAYRRWTRRQT